jgi:dihydrofolate synthase / folylpolyglutamate synthase
MEIIPIRTRTILPPKDDIYQVIDEFVPGLREGDVFVITSKVVAIHQGRCVPTGGADKDALVEKEADILIPGNECAGTRNFLTVKQNTLIAFAGIDESNANGYYILWPENPAKTARDICNYLKKKFSLKKLAVIITDSHCAPMRRGTMGISIGFYGLEPINDYRSKKDIFGREMKITQANIVDALAAAAVVAMGEGKERMPMAIVRGADFVEFTAKDTSKDLEMPLKEDLFYPLLKSHLKNN